MTFIHVNFNNETISSSKQNICQLKDLKNSSMEGANKILQAFTELLVKEISQNNIMRIIQIIDHPKSLQLIKRVEKFFELLGKEFSKHAEISLNQIIFKSSKLDLFDINISGTFCNQIDLDENNPEDRIVINNQIVFFKNFTNTTFTSKQHDPDDHPMSADGFCLHCDIYLDAHPNAVIHIINQNQFLVSISLPPQKIDLENMDSMLKILTYLCIRSIRIEKYSSFELIRQICEIHKCQLDIKPLSLEDCRQIINIIKESLKTNINIIKNHFDIKDELQTILTENTEFEEHCDDDSSYIEAAFWFVSQYPNRANDMLKYTDKNLLKHKLINKLLQEPSEQMQESFLKLFPEKSNLKTLLKTLQDKTITAPELESALDQKSSFSQIETLIRKIPAFKEHETLKVAIAETMIEKCQNYLISKNPKLKDIFTEKHLKNALEKSLSQQLCNEAHFSIATFVEKELLLSVEQFIKHLLKKLNAASYTHKTISTFDEYQKNFTDEVLFSCEGAIFSNPYQNHIKHKLYAVITQPKVNHKFTELYITIFKELLKIRNIFINHNHHEQFQIQEADDDNQINSSSHQQKQDTYDAQIIGDKCDNANLF